MTRLSSMPRGRLRDTSTRPPDGEGGRVAWKIEKQASLCLVLAFSLHGLSGGTHRPFQEGEWNRCVEGRAAGMRRES